MLQKGGHDATFWGPDDWLNGRIDRELEALKVAGGLPARKGDGDV